MLKTIFVIVLCTTVLIGAGGIGLVAAANPAENPGSGVVLFETDKYCNWQWYGLDYPEDTLFAVSLGGEANPGAQVSRDSMRLFAHLGTEPTGGYGIGIEKVTLEGGAFTVSVHTKSPAPGQFVTMAITHPKDSVLIDLRGICLPQELTIRWIDQTGRLLCSTVLKDEPQFHK